MSVVQETFLRRYATSPIHVPRLERLLATYGQAGTGEEFAGRFIGWDDACQDGEAARIVTEVISQLAGSDGRLIRLTDAAVHGAIRWLADGPEVDRAERVATLRSTLAELQGV
jgi:hypothetical protein